ncbi:MAG: repeat containing protein [Actinomycetia bacterium]|nr:repeat containing protein [Actinomycetes bacterium]
MRRKRAIAAVSTLFLGAALAAAIPANAAVTRAVAVHSATTPGTQLWVKRYQGSSDNEATATSVALSPNGGTAFVTGGTLQGSTEDWTTIAYSTATGAQLWVKNFATPVSPAAAASSAEAIAISPNGKDVYVTGRALIGGRTEYFATIAYNATTGAQLWIKRYNPDIYSPSSGTSVVVNPNGKDVYVTGRSAGTYATVAYNAVTGAQLWVKRTAGYGSNASAVVSPDGTKVLVSEGRTSASSNDGYYVTSSYNATTGALLWTKNYTDQGGPKGAGSGAAHAIAISPNGGTVFVTGVFYTAAGTASYATIAYAVANGAQRWVKWNASPIGSSTADGANSIAVNPNGKEVYVTGDIDHADAATEYATFAYNAVTGAQLWVKIYYPDPNLESDSRANAVAVSPDGTKVYIAGFSVGGEYATTIAYNAATGTPLWAENYRDSTDSTDLADVIAVSHVTGRVFVTGSGSSYDSSYYLTIAYVG